MIRACISALLSHWWRNPLQLLTLLGGLVLATALWCGVQAVNSEARASYDAAAATLGDGQFDQLVPRVGDTIPQETFIALRRAGWLVGPVLEGRVRVGSTSLRVVGLDPLTSPGGLGPAATDETFDLTQFLSDPPAYVTAETAAKLEGAETPPLIVNANVAPGTAITDIGAAQRWLERPGQLTRLILAPQQPLGLPPLSEVAPDLVRQAGQTGSDIGRLTDSFHLNLTAFGLLSFAVGIFIVHGAIGLAFEQRRGMIRTLRALGAPLGTLIVLLAAELLALALIGGAVGIVLGYVIASALLPDVAATLQGLYGAQVSGTLQLRPEWWLSGLAICLAGTALAASGALWRVAQMPLLASGQPRAWSMQAQAGRRWQAAAALALLLCVPLLIAFGSGLVGGFALLGALLLGAALALPSILSAVLNTAENRAREVTWQWFWADTRQQLPSLSLALMALLLAMAANVGVSTMVSSFRLTFTAFLDQRLAADLYVSAERDGAALEAFLSPRTDEILPIMSMDLTLAGFPAELYGARVGQTYRDNWRFLQAGAAPWDQVASGAGVIVNEQLARRADIWVGAPLQITPDLTLPVVGVVGDYGNPIGQAIVSEALFQSLFPDVVTRQFGLRTGDAAALREALIDFGLPPGNIIDQKAIKAFSLSVFERTFTVTAALNVLTLSVAAFAMFMSLLTLATMRLPQLAPAWALGMTRRDLGWLEMKRAVILAALTACLALPLGLVLAWVLLAIINVEAFGWRLPMYSFPVDYAKLGLFALLAAVIAALWPSLRLARTPPNDLLKVFANER